MRARSGMGGVERDAEAVVASTGRLVHCQTVNPPGDEEEAVRFLGAYLARAGRTVA